MRAYRARGHNSTMRAEEVIATHGNTDFDALAAAVAARKLYPDAVVCLSGSLNRNVREFHRLHAEELSTVDAARLEVGSVRRLIVVETLHASRLGELEAVALDPAVEKVVFDHHSGDLPGWIAPESVVISTDGALTTTMVGILAERELDVTPVEATLFALGIHEDTGSLTHPTATQRDAEALAWCLRHGARQQLIELFLHSPLGADERELLTALVDRLETRSVNGIDVLVAAVSWPRYVDGISVLAHKVVELTDARALVLLVEMDGRVFCVTRSRSPELDAAAVAAALGGGGHAQASSAIFRGPLDTARSLVEEALPAAVREPVRAGAIMSRPPRFVGPDETVSTALSLCQRHGQSGILVVDDGIVVGAAGREDLDRAVSHGLSHAPVKAIMSGRVATAAPDVPLAELQRLLAGGAPRIAVVEEGQIAGVVTRSDVLRALGEPAESLPEPGGDLGAELAALDRLRPAFEAVSAVAGPYEGVYLVGGTVRDILLGEPGFDVDIAVEGDAIALAHALAAALGGRVRPHEKFGTAAVIYGEHERIDVVTARTEFYEAPAALPSVEHASIRDDLFRRDFTINAMAVSLKGDEFGRLVDPFDGRRDLERRAIRVLHNLSFVDDPTRIFRAIRYENRYGFRMEEHTLRLARGCVDMGLVGDLSSARLRDELVALLEEGEVEHSILRLAEIRVAAAVHPHLAADAAAVALLRRLVELKAELAVDVPDWRLGLVALARRMPSGEVVDWLDRLKVRRRDAEAIATAVTVAPKLVERLRDPGMTPAEVALLADQLPPDALLYALALEELEPLRTYFGRLRDVRIELTGRDLAALGLGESPRVGEVLTELRRRKLNGELDGRDSELAAARELIDS
jgi:tRNA nucleotidyltransferase (CCA-adding enzyme)